jgi:hypothetical protein
LTSPPETILSCYPQNAPSKIPTAFRTAPLFSLFSSDAFTHLDTLTRARFS